MLERIENCKPGFARQRIPSERAAQAAGAGRIHYLGAPGDSGQRQAAAERFRSNDNVGLNPITLAREQSSGAPKTALHFVGDKQDAMLVTDINQRWEKLGGGAMNPPSPSTGSAMTAATSSEATTRLKVSSK